MTTKLFEIRDRGTFIPVMATKMALLDVNEFRGGELEVAAAEEYILGETKQPKQSERITI